MCVVGGTVDEGEKKLASRGEVNRVVPGRKAWVDGGGGAHWSGRRSQYQGRHLARPRSPRSTDVTAAVLMVMPTHVVELFLGPWRPPSPTTLGLMKNKRKRNGCELRDKMAWV